MNRLSRFYDSVRVRAGRIKMARRKKGIRLAVVAVVLAGLFAQMADTAPGFSRSGFMTQRRPVRRHWVGTWAASPTPVGAAPAHFNNQTLRLIVHASIGGDQLRIHISNTFGAEPLTVGAAHVALRKGESKIAPGSDRPLTFSGKTSITIPSGALAVSDPANLSLPLFTDIAVSIYLPGPVTVSTVHSMALQTSYVSPAGDFTGADSLPAASGTITSWPFLTGISVSAVEGARSIIALGDSITDGAASQSNANGRWPDVLAERLGSRPGGAPMGVLNEGISGNRLLHDGEVPAWPIFGPSALARFDRDVVAQPGVSGIIVLLGINDIGHPGSSAPGSEDVSADDIIAGLKQLIERAHERALRIFGCTLTPFEGTRFSGYFTPAKETKRETVNEWIRTGGAYDGIIDFDKVARDPQHPSRLLPAYDSGDHLHPNGAGLKAMGEAIDLSLLR
jgi:lysophospholipase L1-like esterase